MAGGKKVLILGGGAGGVVAANILASKLRGEAEITLVDKSSYHVFQPSQPWVMMGQREPDDIRRPLRLLERKGVRVLVEEVESIKPEEHSVQTSSRRLDYDYLVVALGSIPEPEKIPGDTRRVCTPWTLEGALECRKLLAGFKGGSVVVTPVSWPYKCPPAPFEVAFMVKYLAEQRGVNADITVAHFWKEPMDPFGSMLVNAFKKFLDQYGVGYAGGVEVDSFQDGILVSRSGERLKYDLAIVVPPHSPPKPVAESELGDESIWGYMRVDKVSLRAPKYDNVYGVGDVVAPSLNLGMAGVFAHFQAEYVASRIVDEIKGVYMGAHYNKSGVCVMDMGYVGAAVYCDFTKRIAMGEYPDCVILGGMKVFRALKYAFEKFWLSRWF